MFRAEPEGGDEAGQEQEGKLKIKATLKPKQTEDELADEVSLLKDRLSKLELKDRTVQRLGERPADSHVGTAFPEEVIDRLNQTIQAYEKSGLKLYKRKVLESGLIGALDDLNSVWQIDDSFKKSRGDVEKFVGFLAETVEEAGETETDKTWVWTKERAVHVIHLFRGRPTEIEQLLKAEPTIRQFVDFQTIETAKKASKPKIKGAEESGDLFEELGLTGDSEEEEKGEASEGGEEKGEGKGDLLDELGVGEEKEGED